MLKRILTGLLTLLMCVGAVWAQTPGASIGFVNNGSAKSFVGLVKDFQRGLAEVGFEEGRNVAIQYRWADGDNSRLPALLEDLVERRVSLIATTGGSAVPLAARKAAKTIPIVFAIGADPVKMGLVPSLNRPGGNLTGVSFLANALLAKQIEILHEATSKDAVLGYLSNPANPNAEVDAAVVRSAVAKLGRKLVIVKAINSGEIDTALLALAQQNVRGLLIFPDALFTSNREHLVELVSRYKLPSVYNSREYAAAGGFIGYGAKQSDAYRQAGSYVGRILKGEKPAELPVIQSSSIEMVINLRAAKALNVDVPQTLLARADEIIE